MAKNRRLVGAVACGVVLSLVLQMLPGLRVPTPVTGGTAFAADLLAPIPPPAAVDPTPSVTVVSTPGPTEVTSNITVDTVWGPQGSPYIVRGSLVVNASLTLLPGTVIKLDGYSTDIDVNGQLLALGTPNRHIVITSYLDDTVLVRQPHLLAVS